MSSNTLLSTAPDSLPGIQWVAVRHRTMDLDGHRYFYREAGPDDAPVVLLPHGYPCSSYEFRNFMAALGDRWRLVAPDLPGFGHSATPDEFDYSFEGYSRWLERFCLSLGLDRFVLYLHDYGTWIGLRLAMRSPDRIAGLILQNGDIYEDTMGPKYEGLKKYFANPTAQGRAELLEAVSGEGYRDEFLNGAPLPEEMPPDLWTLHWALTTHKRKEIALALMEDLKGNLSWFPRYQQHLHEYRPPTLICWGPRDGYMPEASARAYLRDLPQAELHLLDGGHWLLETHLEEMVRLCRGFLERVHRP